MLITFGEIINEVIRGLGLDSNTIETRVLESIKLRINEIQDVIVFNENWDWRSRTFYLTTRKPHSIGTISTTQGSKVVNGVSTAWPDTLRTGYLRVSGRMYKIQEIVSSVQLKLVTPYDKPDETNITYDIVFPEEPLNHEISTLVQVRHQGIPLQCVHKSRLTLINTDISGPTQCAMGDRTSEDYYSNGTVSVTSGSAAITGSGGAYWTEEMEGMTFRVNEFSKNYTIKTVVSPTSMTLKENYDGETGVAKTYKINPAGTQLLVLRSTPNDYYVLELEALINFPRLVNNSDISLIPNHMPLIHGATWLALSDMEAKNPIRIQQARSDFERTLKQLKSSSRIITNVAWKSEREMQARKRFNPLER